MKIKEKNPLTNPCQLCQSEKFVVISNRSRDGEYLRTVICKDCGLIRSDPFPIEPEQYYKKDYRIKYKGVFSPQIKHIYRAAQVAIHRYEKVKKFIPDKSTALDIGSGGGEYIRLLSGLGFTTTGIEPHEGYGNYSRREYNLDIRTGFAQNIDFNQETFDLISLWHVLEHLDSPGRVLKKVNHWLKEKGILIVEVPNIEATCQSPKNTFHTAHLFNFNLTTLSCFLKKSGFSLIDQIISTDGGNITLIAERNNLKKELSPASSFSENYSKITSILKKHSLSAHFLSHHPYSRPLRKLFRSLREIRISKRFKRGRDVLDYCYSQYIKN
jgi:2-polyprenyl-3-methyl-5-hydroxy-6-metoxy-1,4-benzoquinol methylase